MVEKRLARHNAVGEFPDIDSATAALDALHEGGFEAEELSLLGPAHEKAPGDADVTEQSATTTTSGVGRKALAGIGAGVATGAGIGALAGAAATAIPGVGIAVGAGALYTAVAGGAVGHIAGALIGVEAGARKSMMWAQSLEPVLSRVEEGGHVLVGVHSDDADRADLGEKTLAESQPLDVHRLEADETFVPPGDVSAVAGRSVPSSDPTSPGGELGRDEVDEREGKTVGVERRGEYGEDSSDEDSTSIA